MRIMPETVISLCQLTSLMVSCLLLLPWCIAIAGYWISSSNSNSQQQLTASYRQASKSLSGTSWPTKSENHHKQNVHVAIQVCFTMPTVLCMSNGLICGYITGIHFCLYAKEVSHHASLEICHSSLKFYEYYYVDYMPIIV